MPIRRGIHLYNGERFFRGTLPIYVNRVEESYESSEHRHDFLEISYVSEGTGTHHVGDRALPVAQGDIFLIPIGISHVFRPASASKKPPLIIYNLVISLDAATKLLHAVPGGSELKPLLRHTECQHYRDHYGELQRTFQQARFEYASARAGREAALYTCAMSIFLFVHRAENGFLHQETNVSDKMEAVFELVDTRYSGPLSTGDMAAVLGIGERQFHRMFVKRTGTTPRDYVQAVRIREACRLLRMTDRKVSDIASSVGYQDMAFFNGLFRKQTGVSPSAYRNRLAGSSPG
ncbi:helix-turn-helix domain-containing protein [Paenibacillus sp. MBLB4367]|uniref:helix-turn-helix domain-containing protein n=1 Tax=Paenibacillus sp. MBLB4367 TaxID=3384767 RepID=UPI003907FE77